MSQADVSVAFQIEVQRDKFKVELEQMRADFEQWRMQAVGAGVEIPLRLRDEASAQLATLMQSLQAQASSGITIPVNMGGAGGGGGLSAAVSGLVMGNPYSAVAAGALPSPLIGPMRGLSAEATVGAGPTAAAAMAGSAGMSWATLNRNIDEVGSALDARNRMLAAAAGGEAEAAAAASGNSGASGFMRGLRLMAGVHVAAQGIEAAYGSYEYTMGDRDPEIDPGSVAALKEEKRRIKEMRSGFYGLTGVGRDLFHWAGRQFAPMSGGDDGFDDTANVRDLERRIRSEQRQQREAHVEDRLRGMGQSDRDFIEIGLESLAAATAPDSLGRKIGEINKAATRLADAYNKRADELESEAAKSTNPTIKKANLDLAEQLRQDARRVPAEIAGVETDRLTHQNYVQTQLSREAMSTHLSVMGLNADGMEDALSGDTHGAAINRIEGQRRTSRNAALAEYRRRAGTMSPVGEGELGQEFSIIDRMAEMQTRAADLDEWRKVTGIENQTKLASIDGNFERQRAIIRMGVADAIKAEPARRSLFEERGRAELAAISRAEHREAAGNWATALETDVASGANPRVKPELRGNTHAAMAMALLNREREELRQHTGPEDEEMRESIREKYAAEARRRRMTESDPAARRFLDAIAKKDFQGAHPERPGGADVTDGTGGSAYTTGGATPEAMQAAVERGIAKGLASCQKLYIVKF